MADGSEGRPGAGSSEVEGWHVVLRDGRVAYVGTRARCTQVCAERAAPWLIAGVMHYSRSQWEVSYRIVRLNAPPKVTV